MAITPYSGTVPNRLSAGDNEVYATQVYEWFLYLDGTWVSTVNSTETNINNKEVSAVGAASTATTAASTATTKASEASASAASASTSATQASNYSASYSATSTSSVLIGTGAKTFTIQAGKLFVTGQYLLISDNATPSNYMHGQVTSYSGTTLVMNITNIGGSGTISLWDIAISGTQGATGATGGGMANLIEDTTPQLGGDLDANGKTFNTSSYRQIVDASIGTGTHTFNYANGDSQKVTATGSFTLAFSNFVTGKLCFANIEAVNWGDYTITLPAGIRFVGATAPTFTSGGTDEIIIKKDDDEVYTMIVHNDVGVPA